MICPNCKGQAEVIDSRQLDEWRYRRYRCLTCQARFTTGEFIVAIGNRPGPKPVERWLEKVRAQGAASLSRQLLELLQNKLTGDIDGTSKAGGNGSIPEAIRADPVAEPDGLALATEGE